jgi:hypothetical protein
MTTKTVPTFTATIYVGLKERSTGQLVCVNGREKIQEYVNSVGLCVTYTHTEFFYTGGKEPGIIVGLINYPRFPSSPELIKAHALAIAEMLLKECKQLKVSVVMPDETIMLEVES